MATSGQEATHPIFKLLPQLDKDALNLLYRQAHALSQKPEFLPPNQDSDIADDRFVRAFGERLVFHHAVVPEPMSKKAFEYAFEAASRKAGRVAEIVLSNTNAGADIRVDDTSYSLKSEAHSKISRDWVHISKLRESATIQDTSQTLEELARRAISLVQEHITHYSRILTLRVYRLDNNRLEYELLEIPYALFEELGRISPADFRYKGRGQQIPTAPTKTAVATLNDAKGVSKLDFKLDISDGKLTIANLRYSLCRSHGKWVVSLPQDLAEVLNQPESE